MNYWDEEERLEHDPELILAKITGASSIRIDSKRRKLNDAYREELRCASRPDLETGAILRKHAANVGFLFTLGVIRSKNHLGTIIAVDTFQPDGHGGCDVAATTALLRRASVFGLHMFHLPNAEALRWDETTLVFFIPGMNRKDLVDYRCDFFARAVWDAHFEEDAYYTIDIGMLTIGVEDLEDMGEKHFALEPFVDKVLKLMVHKGIKENRTKNPRPGRVYVEEPEGDEGTDF